MGKARIRSVIGNGQYDIDYLFDTSLRDINLKAIEERLTKLFEELQKLNASLTIALAEAATASGALQTKIASLTGSEITSSDFTEIAQLQATFADAQSEVNELRIRISENEASTEELKNKKLKLQQLDEEVFKPGIWCADLTEDIPVGTEVGVAEVPGEDNQEDINIKPAGGNGQTPEHSPIGDGIMTHALVQTPEAAFYNIALEPGWLKFNPRYRYGRITAILGNFADVVLIDPLVSKPIAGDTGFGRGGTVSIPPTNPGNDTPRTLSSIEIEYLTCNGSAFGVGDEVIIDYRGDNPKIIGFKDNPKGCNLGFLLPVGNLAGGQAPNFSFTANPNLLYGRSTWKGAGSITLSWDGPANNQFAQNDTGEIVYHQGSAIAQIVGENIVAAAVRTKGDATKELVVMTRNAVGLGHTLTVWRKPWPTTLGLPMTKGETVGTPTGTRIGFNPGGESRGFFNDQGDKMRIFASGAGFGQTFASASVCHVVEFTVGDAATTSAIVDTESVALSLNNTLTTVSVLGNPPTQAVQSSQAGSGTVIFAVGWDPISLQWIHAKYDLSYTMVETTASFVSFQRRVFNGIATADFGDGQSPTIVYQSSGALTLRTVLISGIGTLLINVESPVSIRALLQLYNELRNSNNKSALSIYAESNTSLTGGELSNSVTRSEVWKGFPPVGTLGSQATSVSGVQGQRYLVSQYDPRLYLRPQTLYQSPDESAAIQVGQGYWQVNTAGSVCGSHHLLLKTFVESLDQGFVHFLEGDSLVAAAPGYDVGQVNEIGYD